MATTYKFPRQQIKRAKAAIARMYATGEGKPELEPIEHLALDSPQWHETADRREAVLAEAEQAICLRFKVTLHEVLAYDLRHVFG